MVLYYIQWLCDNRESAYDLVVLMLIYKKRGGSQIWKALFRFNTSVVRCHPSITSYVLPPRDHTEISQVISKRCLPQVKFTPLSLFSSIISSGLVYPAGFNPLPSISPKRKQKELEVLPDGPLVHSGTLWYNLMHSGTFWYTLVHSGTP